MFGEYLRQLPPIVAKYGGEADRIFQPRSIRGDGLTLPDAVNLVHYDDKESYLRFGADPDFCRIEPLRSGSVELQSFEGTLIKANPSSDGLAHRLYTIDVGFTDDAQDPPRNDERVNETVLTPGYEVEYVLSPEAGWAATDRQPNLVTISYVPNSATTGVLDRPGATGHTGIQITATVASS